jgi:hypothetical protein
MSEEISKEFDIIIVSLIKLKDLVINNNLSIVKENNLPIIKDSSIQRGRFTVRNASPNSDAYRLGTGVKTNKLRKYYKKVNKKNKTRSTRKK